MLHSLLSLPFLLLCLPLFHLIFTRAAATGYTPDGLCVQLQKAPDSAEVDDGDSWIDGSAAALEEAQLPEQPPPASPGSVARIMALPAVPRAVPEPEPEPEFNGQV